MSGAGLVTIASASALPPSGIMLVPFLLLLLGRVVAHDLRGGLGCRVHGESLHC